MWRITWKGLLAHRVRLLLTTLSVVLGVAFVSGTYVLTDTMGEVFDDLVRGGSQTVDIYVRGETSSVGADAIEQLDAPPPTLPESLLEDVLAVDGVGQAEGAVEGYALIVKPDGEAIVPMGPPSLGGAWSDLAGRILLEGGHPPRGPDEVVVDATTVRRNDLQVGDRLTMVFASTPPREFTLVGASRMEEGDNLAGATYAEFDMATAQDVLDLDGAYTGINVWAGDGADPDELATRLDAALGSEVDAITAEAWADETMEQIEASLGFITMIMGIFAGIALVVGAFIIANTFSITVLQRSREFALLRALGASRRQVVGGVVAEAVAVGLAASILGVVAGLGLAAGLQSLLRVFGFDMPEGTLVLQPRTILVGLAVGLVVTVLSSLLPARRAASVHPVAALRDVSSSAYRPPRARLVAGIVAAVAAAATVGYGAVVQPDGAGTLVGVGALLAVVALGATGPSLTRPVLRLLGGNGERFGAVGHIARGNSMRTPRRTWTTAAALTIGLALVSGVAVMAASIKASATGALDQTLKADVYVSASNAMTGGGVPPVLATQLAELPEVGAVSPVRGGPGRVDGAPTLITSIDPLYWDDVASTVFTNGSLNDLATADVVAVDADLAAERGYAVGDVVPAEFSAVGATELRIGAVYEPDEILSGWLLSTATFDQYFTTRLDAAVLVKRAPDIDAAALQAAVEEVASAYPSAVVQDQAQYRDTVAAQIDQILALVTALLGMALFIAVLGIMNTLALSIHERTREIGLLRAVGMTRRQVRMMVRWEAVTVALLGVVVGVLLGTVLGWATIRALAEDGLSTFVIPFTQLLGAALLAVVAGVVAAILPARAAAKLDVLRAVIVE